MADSVRVGEEEMESTAPAPFDEWKCTMEELQEKYEVACVVAANRVSAQQDGVSTMLTQGMIDAAFAYPEYLKRVIDERCQEELEAVTLLRQMEAESPVEPLPARLTAAEPAPALPAALQPLPMAEELQTENTASTRRLDAAALLQLGIPAEVLERWIEQPEGSGNWAPRWQLVPPPTPRGPAPPDEELQAGGSLAGQ
jgi:hypothetical protein